MDRSSSLTSLSYRGFEIQKLALQEGVRLSVVVFQGNGFVPLSVRQEVATWKHTEAFLLLDLPHSHVELILECGKEEKFDLLIDLAQEVSERLDQRGQQDLIHIWVKK